VQALGKNPGLQANACTLNEANWGN
jgi:hypothetical protein